MEFIEKKIRIVKNAKGTMFIGDETSLVPIKDSMENLGLLSWLEVEYEYGKKIVK